MASSNIITRNKYSEEKDGLTFVFGSNTITFEYPFFDDAFVAVVSAPNVTIRVVSKSATGMVIDCSADTDEGFYRVSGTSPLLNTAEYNRATIVNRGSGITLTAGRNTITFEEPYSDKTFSFVPNGNGIQVEEDRVSRTTTSVVVVSADDNENFDFIAEGR